MQRQAIDAVSLIDNTVSLLDRTLPSNIVIQFSHEPGSYILNADRSRLQQALMNLAVNARDAMPDGGTLQFILSNSQPPVEVIHESEFETADWLALQVKDSGQGIEPETMNHIFEPFFTTKEVGKGTGLGLAQVYGIVKQLDGEITVESEPGNGTTISLYFPTVDRTPAPVARLKKGNMTVGPEFTLMSLEHNRKTRQSTQDILQILGCRVVSAENGQEALALYPLQEEPIDLVITDIIMPEMSGIELYQALKKLTPDLKLLIMTGYPLNDQARELLELGHIDWIQKPYLTEEMAEKIANLVGHHQ
jgi:CheY-like chemotaxis protein